MIFFDYKEVRKAAAYRQRNNVQHTHQAQELVENRHVQFLAAKQSSSKEVAV